MLIRLVYAGEKRDTGPMDPPRRLAVKLAVSVFALWGMLVAQSTELDRLVGKDLWKKPPNKREQVRLAELIGKIPDQQHSPEPWHVWRIKSNGQARYVILLGEQEVSVPGGSSACVELFDVTGNKINSWSFQTGWRGRLDSASIEFSNGLASDLIVLNMVRLINGRDIAKEYFAIRNDQLKFVRMENAQGEAVQNEYLYSNLEIGVVPRASGLGQWTGLLESTDRADVLSALMFLGGRHFVEPPRSLLNGPDKGMYADVFQELAGSPRIQELIERLSHSQNEWIRQAALLAARGPHDR